MFNLFAVSCFYYQERHLSRPPHISGASAIFVRFSYFDLLTVIFIVDCKLLRLFIVYVSGWQFDPEG